MSARAIWAMLTRRCNAVFGRGHGITPHTLEHALATRADQEGAALGDISAMLGHKSTRITHTYLTKTSDPGDAPAGNLAMRYPEVMTQPGSAWHAWLPVGLVYTRFLRREKRLVTSPGRPLMVGGGIRALGLSFSSFRWGGGVIVVLRGGLHHLVAAHRPADYRLDLPPGGAAGGVIWSSSTRGWGNGHGWGGDGRGSSAGGGRLERFCPGGRSGDVRGH